LNKPLKTTLINGIFADYINVNDRAIHYGDGLFETLLCHDRKIYYWAQHYQRLQNSAQRLKFKCPDEKLLLDDIKRLLDNTQVTTGKAFAIKLILSRGMGERGYKYTRKIDTHRLVMLSELDVTYSSLLCDQLLAGELYLCKTQASINETLAGLKHLNRLENVLANNEWHNTSKHLYIDGLMLDADSHVVEGTMSNIFAVKDNRLFTPDLQRSGVRGIMRDEVIRIANDNDIDVSVSTLTTDELYDADEVFLTNSLIGLKSVTSFGDADYGQSPITQSIFYALSTTKEKHVQVI